LPRIRKSRIARKRGGTMKRPSKKLVRPTVRTPKEYGGTADSASIYVEVDAGAGQHVAFEIKIALPRRNASSLAPVVGELKTSSAEIWDEPLPDQPPDDPEYGPYVYSIFSDEPVRMRRPKRGWRRFGRRR
jgi:hypothetical protein